MNSSPRRASYGLQARKGPGQMGLAGQLLWRDGRAGLSQVNA